MSKIAPQCNFWRKSVQIYPTLFYLIFMLFEWWNSSYLTIYQIYIILNASKIYFQYDGHFTQKCIPFLVEADVTWIAPMTHHSFVKLCIWPAAWYWSWSTLIKMRFSPMGQIWTPPWKVVGHSWTPFLIILKAFNFGKQLFIL